MRNFCPWPWIFIEQLDICESWIGRPKKMSERKSMESFCLPILLPEIWLEFLFGSDLFFERKHVISMEKKSVRVLRWKREGEWWRHDEGSQVTELQQPGPAMACDRCTRARRESLRQIDQYRMVRRAMEARPFRKLVPFPNSPIFWHAKSCFYFLSSPPFDATHVCINRIFVLEDKSLGLRKPQAQFEPLEFAKLLPEKRYLRGENGKHDYLCVFRFPRIGNRKFTQFWKIFNTFCFVFSFFCLNS